MTTPRRSPIAVVGMAALFPGSVDNQGFWRDIVAGRDLITDVPPTHWLVEDYYDPDPRARDKTYARRGAFLSEVDFDPVAWGVPPSIVSSTDTTQLLALIVAHRVLEDACGARFKTAPRDRTSVILGVTSAQELLGSMVSRLQRPVWVKSLREMGLPEDQVVEACDRIASHYVEWQENTFPGVLGNVVAGRIANRLNLGGTNCVTDAACASSFSALAMAVAELRLGESDLVITGGADTMNDIFMYVCFSKTPALSPSGDCRPFSEAADGTMLGEGIGMVALRRLEDAERDGDQIYAILTGVGSSSDGRAKSVYAPVAAGQATALRRAYEQAGHGPDTVGLVEAHGTGTQAGDAAEFEGLRRVFDESGRADRGYCALGSVKSQVGHTKAASGAAGLFKAVMALHHKVLPPTIKVDRPDPKLLIETSPFHLNTVARPWIRQGYPRRASVSSFGFGGSNFHATLEEYTGRARRPLRIRPMGGEVVLAFGDSPAAVADRCRELAGQAGQPGMLPYLARSTQEAFEASAPARLAVFAESEADLVAKLGQAADLVAPGRDFATPGGIEFVRSPRAGEVAFLFPGQGSQYLGMSGEVTMTMEAAQRAWDDCAAVDLHADCHLEEVVFPRPVFSEPERQAHKVRLTATEWAQPALGAASLALLEVAREVGLSPAAVSGHSLGELTALCAAGVLTPGDLLRVARRRGELMARVARVPGAMMSVAACRKDVEPLLVGSPVVVANYNTPHQLVLSGPTDAVVELERRLAEAGMTTTRLEVATAFHSPLVSPACSPFREFLATVPIRVPEVDVYANSTAAPYPRDPDAIRDELARQLAAPVRFVDQIEAMYARGIRTFVEIGPGRVLTNLVGHILKDRPHRAIAFDRKGRPGLASLSQALGSLSIAGIALHYDRLWAPFLTPDPRALAAPSMVLKVGGASYGKLYPPMEGAAALPKPNPNIPLPTAVVVAPPAAAPTGERPVPMAESDRALQLAWVQAFQETQRQTAEAHASFQRAMGEAHAAFLRSADASLASLAGVLGGVSTTSMTMPVPMPMPVSKPMPRAPTPPPVHTPTQQVLVPPPPTILEAPAQRPMPMSEPPVLPTPPASAPAAATIDLPALMLSIVAEKTGYPREMLGLDMDLEADLGVDSIKRVEIMAAALERVPGMAELSGAKMATLRTLRQIVASLDQERAGPAPSSQAAPAKVEPRSLERLAVRAVPAAALGLGAPGLLGAQCLAVTNDGAGVAAALVARLASHGARAQLVEEVPEDADAVIFLGGLAPLGSIDAALDVNRAAFRAARVVASRFAEQGGTFIAVQDTGGDCGLGGSERAWLAGGAALAKTAAIEWPLAVVRALDVERGERTPGAIADAIYAELLAGGAEPEVGLSADGTRRIPQTMAGMPAGTGAVPLTSRSVVVASGGARGVTAACMIALARWARCRFLLLGRTELAAEPEVCRGVEADAELKQILLADAQRRGESVTPVELGKRAAAVRAAREIVGTLTGIRAAGGEARYAQVDVTDPGAVAAALDDARAAWGPITGIVHGAGVLADRLIADKTLEQWEHVFDTKVAGLRALLHATRDDELAFLLLFSSVAARFGNRGQADYAMANEVLNKVAVLEQRRRGDRCRVRAIGWGPWEGGMVDETLRARFATLGIPLIPINEGARRFVGELLAGAGEDPEIVLGGSQGSEVGHLATHEMTREIEVDRAAYPFLDGHRVQGTVIVPIALVVEWFARAAKACRPDLTMVTCREVQVLRGIRLVGFDGGRDRLIVRARQLSNGRDATLALELTGTDGARYYAATCDMKERAPASPERRMEPANLRPWTLPLYDGKVLFHGPEFQTIRRMGGVSERAMVASVVGTRECGWSGPWQLDPALLDAGLQVALLWTRHTLGGAGLPTAIGSVHLYEQGPARGAVQCVLEGFEAGRERTVTHIELVREGRIIAELRGVEVHRLPANIGTAVVGSGSTNDALV